LKCIAGSELERTFLFLYSLAESIMFTKSLYSKSNLSHCAREREERSRLRVEKKDEDSEVESVRKMYNLECKKRG
jgi:hypothetical protein